MKQSKVRVISPPFICGKIMFVKILKYDAPSILASYGQVWQWLKYPELLEL